ncbi:MAG: hypothetical protein JJU28_20005 [Cyclobacteriaceae bacterium]|nr:hypothetical protein [Cyclobacteriaceae bacterium]
MNWNVSKLGICCTSWVKSSSLNHLVLKFFMLPGIIILFLVLIHIEKVHAQSPRVKKITFQYVNPPLYPLSSDFKSYRVNIEGKGLNFNFLRYHRQRAWVVTGNTSNYGSVEKAQSEFLNLHGFDRVETNPDLVIEAKFSPISILAKNVVRHDHCHSISAPCFAYNISYSFGAHMKMYDRNGNILKDTVYADPSQKMTGWFGVHNNAPGKKFLDSNAYSTFSYRSPEELEHHFQKSFATFEAELARDYLLDFEENINNLYGSALKEQSFDLSTGRKNRNNNYDDLDKALDLIEKAVINFNQQKERTSWEPDFLEALDIWQKALKESDMNDNKARIYPSLASLLYCNISIVQLWLENWEEASSYADKAKVLNTSSPYPARILTFIDQRMERKGKLRGQ